MRFSTRIVFLVIAILLLLTPIIFYVLKFGTANLSADFSDWSEFASFLGGTLGIYITLLTLVITAWIAIEFNNFQKRQTTIQLFKEFRTEKIVTHRSKAWEVKKEWDKAGNKVYRNAFIEAMIAEKNEDYVVPHKSVKITSEQVRGVYELFAIYSMLSTHTNQRRTMESLNYFYYAWWREFLYEVAEKYDSKREEYVNDIIRQQKTKYAKAFLKNIKFKPKLMELDKICGFHTFTEENGTMGIYKK